MMRWVWLVLALAVAVTVAARETLRHQAAVRARTAEAARTAAAARQRADSVAREAATNPAPATVRRPSLVETYHAAGAAARGLDLAAARHDRAGAEARAQTLAAQLQAAQTLVEVLSVEAPPDKAGAVQDLRARTEAARRQLDEVNAALGSNPPAYTRAGLQAQQIDEEVAAAEAAGRALIAEPQHDPYIRQQTPKLKLTERYTRAPTTTTTR